METNSEYLLTFLLNATWQITVVAALAALASRLLSNGPARYRQLIWMAALLAAIIVPIYSTTRPVITASRSVDIPVPVIPHDAVVSTAASKPVPSAGPAAPPAIRFSSSAGAVVTGIYFLVLLYGCFRFGRAWFRTLSIRATGEACLPPAPLARVWMHCMETFGLTGVQLLRSKTAASPLTVGALCPAVIVPDGLWEEPSEELLTAAIGHELAHVARNDFPANLFYELIFVFIAFHPAAWYMRRELQRTREIACDEAVTTLLLKPQAYARSILQIANTITQTTSPAHTLGIFDGGALEDRIRRVLQKSVINVRRARLFFALALSSLVAVAGLTSGFALIARGQTAFQTHMKDGIAAYNAGDFRTASSRFSSAVATEPADISAKLYLANSLMSEFYAQPGQPDLRLRNSAMQQYTDVLARDPKNKQALTGMGALTMEAKQLDEAYQWATKVAAVDPNDKAAWYTLGVLNWAIVFPEYQRARIAAGGAAENYEIPDANLRKTFRQGYLQRVEEGMRMLQKALTLDANYDDAMAYLNLLYRLKAAMIDNPAEAAGVIAEADKWVAAALEAKRRNPKPPAPASAKLDLNGPPPGPAGRTTMVKAPPPPPPPPPPDRSRQIASALPRPNAEPNQPPLVAEYWQVVGATDMPATDLLRRLKEKGFEAVMYAGSDRLTRVLAGPYMDEAAATRAKSTLEAAGFRVLRKWE